MHIWNNIRNFLYDSEDFIAVFKNNIYLYNISRIDTLSNNLVIVFFNDKKIIIKGSNLKPIKCLKNEILFNGVLESVTINE